MKQFKIVKRFSLAFLGDDWKECYINFSALTVGDMKNKFPQLQELNKDKESNVSTGLEAILSILKEKFIDGKGVEATTGDLVDLDTEDLEALPMEILSKALNFLSQSTIEASQKLLEK